MTVAVVTRKAGPYLGDGAQTVFAFGFKIFATTDIVVTKTDVNGVESTKVINTDYTVAMNADQNVSPGGSVTMTVAPALNEKITISSAVPESQGTSLPQGGAFNAKVVETAFDKVTVLVSQLSEKISRVLRFPISDNAAPVDLPTAANRANMFLAFDASGQPIASVGTTSGAAATAFGKSLVESATATAGRAALGLNEGLSTGGIGTTKGDTIVFTGNGTPVRKGVPTDGKVRVVDSAQSDGWQDVPVTFNWKNRLMNPDGRIAQRGFAATADDTYFVDRWYILSQTGTVTPSALSDPENGYPKGTRITQSQASAQRFGFAQIIEGANCKDLRGQNGVLVPRVRISNSQAIRYAILGWTGTEDTVTSDVVNDWTSGTYTAGNFFLASNVSVLAVGAQTPAANTWTSLAALTAALGSSFNNIVVMVWTEGTVAQNVTLDFDYVQFERGSVATEFERRGYGVELSFCQRYYWQTNYGETGIYPLGAGVSRTTQISDIFVPFPQPMRAAPTFSFSGDPTLQDGGTAFSSWSSIGLTGFGSAGLRSATVELTNTNAWSAVRAGVHAYTPNNSVYWAFNAEL